MSDQTGPTFHPSLTVDGIYPGATARQVDGVVEYVWEGRTIATWDPYTRIVRWCETPEA